MVLVKLRRWLYNVRLLRDKTLGRSGHCDWKFTVGARQNARRRKIRRASCATPGATSPSSRAATVPNRRRSTFYCSIKFFSAKIRTRRASFPTENRFARFRNGRRRNPYMLASNLRDVVVLVDKDRVKSGRYAIEKFGCDTLLLDDGFSILESARPPPRCGFD